jgi:hypothetical protein
MLFQAASLSAFVPRECCLTHRAPASAQTPGDDCHHRQPPREAVPDCALRSTCNGPLGLLATLLSPHAVLAASTGVAAITVAGTPPRHVLERPHSLVLPPDSPPPRR